MALLLDELDGGMERTGDTQWHDLVLADMKAMAAGSQGGRFAGGGYFDVIFGGPENLWEMEPMYPTRPISGARGPTPVNTLAATSTAAR